MELEGFVGVGKNSVLASYTNGTRLEASCPGSNSVAAIENDETNRLIRCGMTRTGASPHVNPLKFADASSDTVLRNSCEALQLPSTTEIRLMQ